MTKQVKLLPLLLITSSLILGGCGKTVNEDADGTIEDSVTAADESAEPEAPQLPKTDYWKPVASQLAGSYSGACHRLPMAEGQKREDATLTIGVDGKYTFKEYSGDLRATPIVMFLRKHDVKGGAGLVFHAASEEAQFGLKTGENPGEHIIDFVKGTDAIFACEPSKGTIPMAGKPLYSVFSGVLEAAPRKITCMGTGVTGMPELTYAFKDGVIRIGDLKYELANMDESVSISDTFGGLNYTATEEAGRAVSVGLNEHGNVVALITHGKDGPTLSCIKD